MKRRTTIVSLVFVGAVSFVSGLNSDDFVIRSDVRLVLLDVSVKDRDGGFVTGLSQDNFSVTENGVQQRITVFSNQDVPVTVGILVDESSSMRPKRDEVLSSAWSFIRDSNPKDEVFVLNFNDGVKRGLPEGVLFSDSLTQLRSALHRGVAEGKTALNDAVVEGLGQLALGHRDKKALVVISDGGDNASRHTHSQTLDLVERSLATVYAVGLFDETDTDRRPAILKQLTKISGGDAFFPKETDEMKAICHAIAQDIRTRYAIGYLPQGGANRSSERRIQVRLSVPGRSGLMARTRTRYRYEEAKN
jgi:Ca-activated chloride channel family protein